MTQGCWLETDDYRRFLAAIMISGIPAKQGTNRRTGKRGHIKVKHDCRPGVADPTGWLRDLHCC